MVPGGQPAEVLGDARPRAAAAAVGQQRQVLPRGQVQPVGRIQVVEDREHAELGEVVAAAARAELRPGLILQAGHHGSDAPVLVHNRVLPARPGAKGRAHAEAGLPLKGLDERLLSALQGRDGPVQHGQAHPAGDVHPHGVGDHRVSGGQHAADGQAVALVGVGHEGAGHRHRQRAGVGHLAEGARLDVLAPALPGGGRFGGAAVLAAPRRAGIPAPLARLGPVGRCWGRTAGGLARLEQGASGLCELWVIPQGRWIVHQLGQQRPQAPSGVARRGQRGQGRADPLHGCAPGDAEGDESLGAHGQRGSRLGAAQLAQPGRGTVYDLACPESTARGSAAGGGALQASSAPVRSALSRAELPHGTGLCPQDALCQGAFVPYRPDRRGP